MTYRQKFNRKYNLSYNTSNSIEDISLRTGYDLEGLKVIKEKGIGAYYSNPKSVRPHIKSSEEWGIARIYASIYPNSKSNKIDKSHLEKVDYVLKKSNRKNKKFMIILPTGKKVHFGDSRYEDFTTHKDEKRKELYIKRHSKNEDWDFSGIDTAGFWSRWLLWNKDTIEDSIKNIEKKFKIKIKYG